jgi:hypothetical protein
MTTRTPPRIRQSPILPAVMLGLTHGCRNRIEMADHFVVMLWCGEPRP